MKAAIARVHHAFRRLHHKKAGARDRQIQGIAGRNQTAGSEIDAAAAEHSEVVDRGVQRIRTHGPPGH